MGFYAVIKSNDTLLNSHVHTNFDIPAHFLILHKESKKTFPTGTTKVGAGFCRNTKVNNKTY